MKYGKGYHSHNQNDNTIELENLISADRYQEKYNNFTNWVSPYKTKGGKYAIEINLRKLNEVVNTCELAKHFIWSDVQNNCTM